MEVLCIIVELTCRVVAKYFRKERVRMESGFSNVLHIAVVILRASHPSSGVQLWALAKI